MTNESDTRSGGREFRIAELAEEAGVSVRTVRFYRERRLLPPPRRDGRIGWYSETHLARLRTIAALLDRGHTLGGIAELMDAWGRGRNLESVAELLGLDSSLARPGNTDLRSGEPRGRASRGGGSRLASRSRDRRAGDPRAGDADVRAQVTPQDQPMPQDLADAVRAAGREVRTHVDALADLFTVQVRTRLLETIGGEAVPSGSGRLAAALKSVHPLVTYVVRAELSLAVDRRVQAELDHWADGPAPRPAVTARSRPDVRRSR
ncbi:MerR family transcriptional regulator [Streptomyces spororaveus]|uniref:MerR family transcriptional regulator n=1 Tax=Streptomyces spororaveus TaxID=284039 RepID=UPI0036B5FA33